jgi:hypothetical protein
MEVPMLEEHEWKRVSPLLVNAVEQIKHYRQLHGVTLAESRANYGKEALAMYFELTGFPETNPDALWHHRVSLYGAPCSACGKPLRTPKAKVCAACRNMAMASS